MDEIFGVSIALEHLNRLPKATRSGLLALEGFGGHRNTYERHFARILKITEQQEWLTIACKYIYGLVWKRSEKGKIVNRWEGVRNYVQKPSRDV